MRMFGRLTLHAESVVVPLLAPDVPVVTWWHGLPPDRLATDPLGVVAERRITEVAQSSDPIGALRQRAEDYAPGDTDLAWTRSTPWRTILAGALDTAMSAVSAVSITAAPNDPTAPLLRGWLANRLRLEPGFHPGGPAIQRVDLRFTNGEEMGLHREGGSATLHRTGLPDRVLPLTRRLLGDQLAEELRRLDADQPYAAALQYATGVTGITDRPSSRVHIWYDPAGTP
jgi:glucose-6-phosphate dehydrogenase assembly protein OpcA